MQIDVFALLTEARQRIASHARGHRSQRDFWLAETDLGVALSAAAAPAQHPNADSSVGPRQRMPPAADIEGDATMNFRAEDLSEAPAASLAGAAAVSGRAQAASDPGSADDGNRAGDAAAARPVERAGLPAGRHAQRLDAAVAHERRLEGIPSRRRAGGARIRARHEGATLGLQRPVARARPSRRSKATRSASSSPTSCPSTRPCTGTACCCRTAWTASAA